MAGLSGKTVALGSPPSSTHQISQVELADWMQEYEAIASSGGFSYVRGAVAGLSGLGADGDYALVITSEPERGVYERVSGSWVLRAALPALYIESLAAMDAESARDAAQTAAGAASDSADDAGGSASAAAISATAAATSQSLADVARTQAQLAAVAAGATIYASVAAGEGDTVNGDVFLVTTDPGVQVYENDAGTGSFLGWLGEILLADVAALKTWSPAPADDTIIRTRAEGFSFAADSTLGASQLLGSTVKLRVLPGPNGVRNLMALGATGADGENISTFIAAAVTAGWDEIEIPHREFTCSPSITNAGGLTIIGNDAVLTSGAIRNANFVGVHVVNLNREAQVLERPAEIPGPSTRKLLFRRTATTAIIVTRDATDKDYIIHFFGQTSDSAPAASVGGDFELMRPQQKRRCTACILYRKDYDSSTGTVAELSTSLDTFFSTGGPVRINSDNAIDVPVRAANLSMGATVTYTFQGRRFGKNQTTMNVAIYATAASSAANSITVNGTEVATFSAVADSAGNSIRIIEFPVDLRTSAGDIDVVVSNDSGTAAQLYVVGLNMAELKDDAAPVGYDTFVVWYTPDDPFSDTNGASEYAYQDASSGLFAGSYHGGETSSYLRFGVEGTHYDTTSLPVLGWATGKSISIKQRTNINSQFDTRSTFLFDTDGVEKFRCRLTGSADVTYFYTMLFPADDGFSYMLFPQDEALSATETTEGLGYDTNEIVQLNPETLQYVRHLFTRFDNRRNTFGGPHIWNRVGTYRKLYYGPIVNNRGTITDLQFEYQREFGWGKY